MTNSDSNSSSSLSPCERSERRAKIVATMGPSALADGMLEKLISAGVDCARLNFSHGDKAGHLRTAQRIREAASKAGRTVSLLADLQGPKIRVGVFADGPVDLVTGETFILTPREIPCTKERAWVSYKYLAEDLRPGDVVLMDDGLLALRVESIAGEDVVCRIVTGGKLSDRKGVNFPGAQLRVPALTEKDRADLRFAVDEVKVDYLALSFVRKASDVQEAKDMAPGVPVIAKIEKPEAITNLIEIIDACDGVMVARGDLGVELGSAKVPLVQKRIIHEANRRGKVVITATQMLDSMIRNPTPTRAEAADIANAILDGTDAIMLSGETASGLYPEEAVCMMSSIALEVEAGSHHQAEIREHLRISGEWTLENSAARGAATLTYNLKLGAVVGFTRGGQTGEMLAGYRPAAPLHVVTPDAQVASRLALLWGVTPHISPWIQTLAEAEAVSTRILREAGFADGTPYALVLGLPIGVETNCVLLKRVGE